MVPKTFCWVWKQELGVLSRIEQTNKQENKRITGKVQRKVNSYFKYVEWSCFSYSSKMSKTSESANNSLFRSTSWRLLCWASQAGISECSQEMYEQESDHKVGQGLCPCIQYKQFILFQIAPLLLGNYLCKFLISSFSKVPGSFISFHIWINCVVLHYSKFVLVEVNTCKLVEARSLRDRKGGEEGREWKILTKNGSCNRSWFDGLRPCPDPRHLIKKVVQSCYAMRRAFRKSCQHSPEMTKG